MLQLYYTLSVKHLLTQSYYNTLTRLHYKLYETITNAILMSIVSTKLTNKTDFQITTVKSTSLFQFVVHFNVNFVKSLCGFKENHKVHATINSPLVQIKHLKKSHLPPATPDIFHKRVGYNFVP